MGGGYVWTRVFLNLQQDVGRFIQTLDTNGQSCVHSVHRFIQRQNFAGKLSHVFTFSQILPKRLFQKPVLILSFHRFRSGASSRNFRGPENYSSKNLPFPPVTLKSFSATLAIFPLVTLEQ